MSGRKSDLDKQIQEARINEIQKNIHQEDDEENGISKSAESF